jgi:hypothetical protein
MSTPTAAAAAKSGTAAAKVKPALDDDVDVLTALIVLEADWNMSPANLRQLLHDNGYTNISEKRLKRLKQVRMENETGKTADGGDAPVVHTIVDGLKPAGMGYFPPELLAARYTNATPPGAVNVASAAFSRPLRKLVREGVAAEAAALTAAAATFNKREPSEACEAVARALAPLLKMLHADGRKRRGDGVIVLKARHEMRHLLAAFAGGDDLSVAQREGTPCVAAFLTHAQCERFLSAALVERLGIPADKAAAAAAAQVATNKKAFDKTAEMLPLIVQTADLLPVVVGVEWKRDEMDDAVVAAVLSPIVGMIGLHECDAVRFNAAADGDCDAWDFFGDEGDVAGGLKALAAKAARKAKLAAAAATSTTTTTTAADTAAAYEAHVASKAAAEAPSVADKLKKRCAAAAAQAATIEVVDDE